MKRLIVIIGVLLGVTTAYAQNQRFDYQATTVNGYGGQPGAIQLPVMALPGAAISFYACSGATTATCSTLANTYNSVSSTTPCPSYAQVNVQMSNGCGSVADNQGNFGAWFLPSTLPYAYTILVNGASYGPYMFTVGGSGGGGTAIVNYGQPFTNATTVIVLPSASLLTTPNQTHEVKDSAGNALYGIPCTTGSDGTYTCRFAEPQSGSIVLNGGSSTGTTSSGVASIAVGPGLAITPSSGIGPVTINSTVPVKPFTAMYAFGDSVSQGDTLASDRGDYPRSVAAYLQIPVTNLAVSGITSNGVDPLIINTLPSLPQTSAGLITYTVGRNNINVNGNSTNQGLNFAQNVFAQGANLAIPNSQWMPGTAMTFSGTTTAGQFAISKAMTGSGSASFTTQAGTIVYVETVMQQTGTGAATISIDGTTQTQSGLSTLYFGGIGGTTPYLAQTSLSRFAGLANTTHNVVITWTSGTVEIARGAAISGSSNPMWPYVELGDVSPLNPTYSDPYLALYLTPQKAMYNQLISDGLTNVSLIDLDDGTFAGTSPLLFNDQYHPTTYGQYIMAGKFEAPLIARNPNLPVPPFLGDVLTNNAKYGMGNMQVGWRNRTVADITGNYNTGVGYYANSNLTTASAVTALGNAAGATNAGSSNMTFLGAGADQSGAGLYVGSTAIGAFSVVNASHRIMLGDPSIVDAFLGNGQGVLTTNNAPILVSHTGAQFFTNPHIVTDFVVLSGGAATVTLSGTAAFTSNTTYSCSANDASIPTNTAGWNKSSSSGTSLVFAGNTTDTITYICVGN